MKSKYLSKFMNLQPNQLAKLPIAGSRLLIELMPQEEVKSSGGIYLTTGLKDNLQAPTVGIVLAVGEGYEDENGEPLPVDIGVGAVVLVANFSVSAFSTFPGLIGYTGGDIAFVREGDVAASWVSIEAFDEYARELNK